jgi:hypothetical protein
MKGAPTRDSSLSDDEIPAMARRGSGVFWLEGLSPRLSGSDMIQEEWRPTRYCQKSVVAKLTGPLAGEPLLFYPPQVLISKLFRFGGKIRPLCPILKTKYFRQISCTA